MFLKHHPWNVHVSGVFSWTIVFRFKPTNEKSAFIELRSFKSLIVKFQASTLDQCHHLLINLSCKSASEPVNAQYYTWARSNRGRQYGWACFLYLHASDLHQHSTFTKAKEQHCSEALIPKLAFYKTFTPMRCGSRCHLVFERLIHVCSW